MAMAGGAVWSPRASLMTPPARVLNLTSLAPKPLSPEGEGRQQPGAWLDRSDQIRALIRARGYVERMLDTCP